MASTFVASAVYDSASSDSGTCNKPTGTAQNDLLLAVVMIQNASSYVIDAVPSGWTEQGKYTDSTDKYYLYSKLAGGSEPANYTWETSGTGKFRIVIGAYRGGFDTADPIDAVSNTSYRTNNSNVIAAGMSVTAAASTLVMFACVYRVSTSTLNFAAPTSQDNDWQEDFDAGDTNSDFQNAIYSCEWSGSGASGDITSVFGAPTNTNTKHAFAVALNVASSGPTYTLTASTGSFTLTGNAASLLASRLLTAATGSFTLTGNAAGLLASRLLTAATGSFALTGNAAGLIASRRLTAETGSFTLTGNDADLVYTPAGGPTYTLTTSTGAFTLTGNAAGLLANRRLTAEVGTFTLTGNAASLLTARRLTAEVGTFTLTSNAASLLASRRLAAATGAFVLTGYAATLDYSGDSAFTGIITLTTQARGGLTVNRRGGVDLPGLIINNAQDGYWTWDSGDVISWDSETTEELQVHGGRTAGTVQRR